MARFFLNNHYFHKILPESLYEGDFEHQITLQAPDLYPDYFVVPFKKTVESPYGNSKPDLIFIGKDYRDWYVVEVEMTHHSYTTHVEPQIQNLANATYDNDVIEYLFRVCPELDRDKTFSLIQNEPVKVLLILNAPQDDWAKDLKNKFGAIISVFEVFHNRASDSTIFLPSTAFEVSGSYPVYSIFTSTLCTVHPYLPFLGIEDNSELNLEPNSRIVLEYKNCVTFWKTKEGPENSIWIKIDGRDVIDRNKKYRITKLRDESLLLDMI